MQERSAGVILVREEEVPLFLLLKYGAGHWDFVKGHIESGETVTVAALRELEEETGIKTADIVEGFEEKIAYTYRRGQTLISKTVVFLLAITKEKEVTLSFEHKDFAWLPFEDAVKRATFKNAQNVLERANNFLK